MKGFNFEKNLSHKQNAVESTLAVFENLQQHKVAEVDKNYINPLYNKIEKQGNVFDDVTTVYLNFRKLLFAYVWCHYRI